MPAPSLRALASPEGRSAIFYLTVFAIPGASSAYLGIWLADKGLTGGEIGWINSVPIFVLVSLGLYVGRLADRASDWRSIIVVGALVSGVLPVAMFFVHDFWGILIAWTLAIAPFGLVMPVIDAAIMRMTRRNGSNFAFLRAFGTVGYMVVLGGTALAAEHFGGGVFLPLILGLTLVRGVLSLLLPKFRGPAPEAGAPPIDAAVPVTRMDGGGRLKALFKPWFFAPILAFALVQGLHYILGAFAGIVWRANGIGEGWVGPLLAIGAAAEVTAMFMFRRLARRFTARHLILFAMLVSAVRWAAMSLNPPLWLLAVLQLTHGITFGISYLGLVNFIANWTSEDVAAEAQSFATVVQLAAAVVILSGFGYLIDAFGIHAFAVGILVSLVAAGLVVYSLKAVAHADNAPGGD